MATPTKPSPATSRPAVVAPSVPLGIAPRPLFTTSTEDAPELEAPKAYVSLPSAKTLAEQAAGKAAISQYVPAE